MKNIHFFGCSFTAGDELSDLEFFPNIKSASPAEYYNVRGEILSDVEVADRYQAENLKKAYPALINIDQVKTHNHARNGESLKSCVFKILKTVSDCKIENKNIDAVYLQLPPMFREMTVNHDLNGIESLRLSSQGQLPTDFYSKYVEEKLKTHCNEQWVIEDFMDILMIAGYLNNIGIKFSLISIHDLILNSRLSLSSDYFNFLLLEFHKIDKINLNSIFRSNPVMRGGHMGHEGHRKSAKIIENHILSWIK